MSLTLNMIVKNEEATLPVCLKSIKDFVDEIIIIDTGSSDNTVEVAKSFGAKVQFFDWVNDFSAARNYALSFVKTPWVIWLDADDLVLNPEDIAKAQTYAQKHRIDAIYSIYKQEATCFQRRLQMFKTKNYRWEGYVHENPIPKKPTLADAMFSDLVVEHRKPIERGPIAARQYLDILIQKDPDNWLGLAESYKYLFHNPDDPLKKSEYRNLADEHYLKALDHPEVNDWTKFYCHFQQVHMNLARAPEDPKWFTIALRNAQVCIALRPDRAEGWGLLGICWKLMKVFSKAVEAFNTALMCQIPSDVVGLVFPAYYDEIPKQGLKEIEETVQKENRQNLIITPEKKEIVIPGVTEDYTLG